MGNGFVSSVGHSIAVLAIATGTNAALGVELDLPPGILENSPVLQQWQQEIPDVLEEIKTDPSFRTRLRGGYSQFPSTNHRSGFHVGVEDLFIGETPVTVSVGYRGSFDGARSHFGVDLRYHLLPLGWHANIAPVIGYHNLGTPDYSEDGIALGARLLIIPSRGGGADLSLSHVFVSPGSDAEIGLSTLSMGYALTEDLRLATDIEKQNSRERKDSSVSLSLEWMF